MLSRNEKIAWKESDERSYTMDLQEFTKFEDISSTRMGISLSKSQFNIKHSKLKTVCTLAFYLLIFRLPFVGPQDRVGILKTEGQNSSFNFSSAISP